MTQDPGITHPRLRWTLLGLGLIVLPLVVGPRRAIGQIPEMPPASVELPPPSDGPKKADAPPMPTPLPAPTGDPNDTLPALDVAPAPAPEPLPVPKEKPADAPPAFPAASDSPPALPVLEDPKPQPTPPAETVKPRVATMEPSPTPPPARVEEKPAPAEKPPAPTEPAPPAPKVATPAEEPAGKGPTVRVYRLSYVKASELAPMIRPFLSQEGTLSVGPRKPDGVELAKAEVGSPADADALIVRDTPDRLAQVDEIVTQVDIPPAQVLVEAVVLSVPVDGRRQLGINFGPIDKAPGFRNAGTPPSPANDGRGGRIISGNLSPEMGAKFGFIDVNATGIVRDMKAGRKINVLASPRLVVLDRQWAAVQFGKRMGYEQNESALPSTLQAVQFLSVETLMNLRPVVSRDGMVRLEIKLENGKDVATADASTSFLVADGETIVVGGLGETPEPPPPSQAGLGLLGFARRPSMANAGRAPKSAKSELVVLLTPRIMGRTPQPQPQPRAEAAPAQVAAQPPTPDVHPAPAPPVIPTPEPAVEVAAKPDPRPEPAPEPVAEVAARAKPEPQPEPAPEPAAAQVAAKPEPAPEPAAYEEPPAPRRTEVAAQAKTESGAKPSAPEGRPVLDSWPTPPAYLRATTNPEPRPEPPVGSTAPDEPPQMSPAEAAAKARQGEGRKVAARSRSADYRWMGSSGRAAREQPKAEVDEPVRRVTLTIPPIERDASKPEPAKASKPHVHAMDLPRQPDPDRELPITVSAAPIEPSEDAQPATARKSTDGRPAYRPGDLTRGVLDRMRSRSNARQQEASSRVAPANSVARGRGPAPRDEPAATDTPERPERLASYSVPPESDSDPRKMPAASPASSMSDPRGDVIYRWHTVAKGEDFGTLAKSLYGSATLRGALWKINRHLVETPEDLRPGTMILLPPPQVMDRIVLDGAMSAADEEDPRATGAPRLRGKP